MKLTLAEQMLYTTVKVSAYKGSQPVGTGTAFFWLIQDGPKHAIMLATNKHVIAGCDRLEVICHLASSATGEAPSGRFATVSVQLDPAGIINHPDPEVDLCALGFSELIDNALSAGRPLFLRTIDRSVVPTPDQWAAFDAIEDVLMVGCPRGIYDEANNHPIVRRGITATSLGKDYNHKAEFMVDMACFPGSSGSPVFLHQIGYVDRSTGNYMLDARRFFFLGVLYQGPLITNEGLIKFGNTPRVEVAAMMHLGQVIRSSKMLEVEDLVRAHLG